MNLESCEIQFVSHHKAEHLDRGERPLKILFLAPQPPWPPNKGDRQRSFALLRALCSRHEVVLSCPATLEEAELCVGGLDGLISGFLPAPPEAGSRMNFPSHGGRLQRFGEFLRDFSTFEAPYAFRFVTDEYRQLIAGCLEDFDAVFLRYMYMVDLLKDFPPRRVVVDIDDIYYLGLRRSASSWSYGWGSPMVAAEALRSYRHEQKKYRQFAQVLVCSETDLSRVHCRRKSVIRNGVDLPASAILEVPSWEKTIVMVGQMSYRPNSDGLLWFLSNVWPVLRDRDPEVRLLVVGRRADPETLPFAVVPGVELVGEVEETASWFSKAVLSIAPLRFGLGTRIKIIESLSCRRAVVSTRIGAEGLDDLDERHGLFRVDDPARMAATIASLLERPDHAIGLAEAGRRMVTARYTWSSITANLASELEDWMPGKRRSKHAATSSN